MSEPPKSFASRFARWIDWGDLKVCGPVLLLAPAVIVFPFTRPFELAAGVWSAVIVIALVHRLFNTWCESAMFAIVISIMLAVLVPVVGSAKRAAREAKARRSAPAAVPESR